MDTYFNEIWSYFGCHFENMHFMMFGAIDQALTKPHDGVSLLTNFSELKLDHRFGFPLDKQA